MIELELELQDWDGCGEDRVVAIPSNIRSELDRQNEYIIISSTPDIPNIQTMDIWELNRIVDDINSENPGMTAELLSLIMNTVDRNLNDEEFVRRIKENDFMFEDLSEVAWGMCNDELAARYIATKLGVPFDTGITKDILEFIKRDEISDYIDWPAIWSQYEAIGFKIIENTEPEECSLYLIHWR